MVWGTVRLALRSDWWDRNERNKIVNNRFMPSEQTSATISNKNKGLLGGCTDKKGVHMRTIRRTRKNVFHNASKMGFIDISPALLLQYSSLEFFQTMSNLQAKNLKSRIMESECETIPLWHWLPIRSEEPWFRRGKASQQKAAGICTSESMRISVLQETRRWTGMRWANQDGQSLLLPGSIST